MYKGKYGATAQYANWLADDLQIPVWAAFSENNEVLAKCNYIILGSSVYVGQLQLGKWIRSHHSVLQGKKIFLFVVCATPTEEKEILHMLVQKNIPQDLAHSAEVFFLRGRMAKSQLSIVDRLVLKIGSSLLKDPTARKKMLADFDEVKKENLVELENAVRECVTSQQQSNPGPISEKTDKLFVKQPLRI